MSLRIPVDERDHFCPKCKVTLVDVTCPRCGGAMTLVEREGVPRQIRQQRLKRARLREESSSSLESSNISIEYFRQRRYMHAHRDDS